MHVIKLIINWYSVCEHVPYFLMLHLCSQMMYDKSGGGVKLRTYTSCTLAWWHNFKHGVHRLWKLFANTVFAPLWHHLYPGHAFYIQPSSLSSIVLHLVYLHQVFPSVAQQISDAMAWPNTDPAHIKWLQDVQFLMDVAIPVVSHALA